MPIFIYEVKKPENISHEAGIEMLLKNTMIKFPVETNIQEEPSIENVYGKYYSLEYNGFSYDYATVTIYAGRKLTMMGMIMNIQYIEYYISYFLQRYLTINGTTYTFAVNYRFGKVVATTTTVAGAEVSDVEYPCTYITFATDYPDACSAIVLGNELTKRYSQAGLYYADALLVYFDGTTVLFVL